MSEDLATLWSLPAGLSCIIRTCATEWSVRVDQNGVTVRECLLPTSRIAVALAADWEREFRGSADRSA